MDKIFAKIVIACVILYAGYSYTTLHRENAVLEKDVKNLQATIGSLNETYKYALDKYKILQEENLKLHEEINNAICENKDWSSTPIPASIRDSIAGMLKSSSSSGNNGRNKD